MNETLRVWTHEELPLGAPSAAAYREGCRCSECKEANAAYMRAYRASRVQHVENPDGTAFYHSHAGQPSKRTARKWLCVHPRCLDLAGLSLVNGVVINDATGEADATFGAVAAAPTISASAAMAALRKRTAA